MARNLCPGRFQPSLRDGRTRRHRVAGTSDNALRVKILTGLGDRWRELQPVARSQIGWAALSKGAAPGWREAIRPLLETLRDETTGIEQERWRDRLERFERFIETDEID